MQQTEIPIIDIGFALVTLVLVAMFLMYQIYRIRSRSHQQSRSRRKTRRISGDIDIQIEQLQRLKAAGKIDERTYYAVLRKLHGRE